MVQGRKAALESALAAVGDRLVQFQYAGDSKDRSFAAAENTLQARPVGDANNHLMLHTINSARTQSKPHTTPIVKRNSSSVGGADLTPQAMTAIETDSDTVSLGSHWLEGEFGADNPLSQNPRPRSC